MTIETKFKKYLNKIDKKRKKKLKVLLYEEGLWKRFKKEPCSTRWHGSHKGGLLRHSVKVTQFLFKGAKAYAPDRWSESTLSLTGLFHDIGKCGNENMSYFIKNEDDKGKTYYVHNSDIFVLPHPVRAIKTLTEAGIVLTEEEWQAIQYHNGLFTPSGKEIKNNQFALTMLLHFADMWVSHVLNI